MYTEETILTFGKYRNHALASAPAHYLYKLWQSRKGIEESHPLLVQYLEENIHSIRKKLGIVEKTPKYNFEEAVAVVRETKKPCLKYCYKDEKDAKKHLREIHRKAEQNNSKHKLPIRAYQCKNCFGWHLTSKPI